MFSPVLLVLVPIQALGDDFYSFGVWYRHGCRDLGGQASSYKWETRRLGGGFPSEVSKRFLVTSADLFPFEPLFSIFVSCKLCMHTVSFFFCFLVTVVTRLSALCRPPITLFLRCRGRPISLLAVSVPV